MATDDKKVAVVPPKELPFVVGVDDAHGFEQITGVTMAIPFIRVLQQLSPQLDKQKPEFVKGAEVGHWFNTTTKKAYGDSIEVIVLKFERIFIEWRPNRGGFAGYHAPENADRIAVDRTFGAWKTADGNLLQENYVYTILLADNVKEGVAVLSLSSSMIKMAKEWNRLMITHIMENGQRALPYYLVWKLKTEYRSNEKGNWYVPKATFVRYVSKEQYDTTKQERLALPSRQVDYAQLEAKSESNGEPEF